MSSFQIFIKPISREDAPLWKKMRKALYHGVEDDFHEEEMVTILNSTEWQCYFIMMQNNEVGFVELSLRNVVDGCLHTPVPYIEGIYLAPEYRQKGIGHEVLSLLKKQCSENGYKEIAADTELNNLSAQQFFLSEDFKETYRTVGFRNPLE